MPGQSGAAEDDFVGECLGRRQRHAELCKKFKPLRGGEQWAKGDFREDPVEGRLYVREKDRHCFASAGGPVQEHLDGHRREVGATARDSSELGPLCLRDQGRHGGLPQHRPYSLPTELLQRTPRALPKLSGFWGFLGTAAIVPPRHVKGTPVAAAGLQTWATSFM